MKKEDLNQMLVALRQCCLKLKKRRKWERDLKERKLRWIPKVEVDGNCIERVEKLLKPLMRLRGGRTKFDGRV